MIQTLSTQDWTSVYILALLTLVVIGVKILESRRKWKHVAGPKPLPLLGNSLPLMNQAHHQLSRWHNEFDSDVIRFLIGEKASLSIRDPELIAKLFGAKKYHKIFGDRFTPILGNSTGVTNDWDNWRKRQAANLHAFRQQDLDSQIVDICTQNLRILTDKVNKSCQQKKPFPVFYNMERLTVDVMGKLTLGADLNCQTTDDKGIFHALSHVNEVVYKRIIIPIPYWKVIPQTGFESCLKHIHNFVTDIVEERKKKANSSNGGGSDIFSAYFSAGLSDKEMCEEIMNCIWPGVHHAGALSLWIYLLASHPELMAKAQAEVDKAMGDKEYPTLDDVKKMEYLDLVVKEGARVAPLYPVLARSPVETENVQYTKNKQGEKVEIEIEPGDYLFCCPYVIHRNPNFWSKPEEFIPERFLPTGDGFNNKAYLGFGLGFRPCVAKSFIFIEAKMIMATLIHNYNITCVPGHKVDDDIAITLKPTCEVLLNFEKRVY